MDSNCLNCNQTINENFCSNCGQKKYKRIDKKYIWDEIQYTLVHTNKGFLYSVKNILKTPGKTAREFVEGDRVNHYKPISLAFVLSGISAFISYKVIHINTILKEHLIAQKQYSAFMSEYISFTTTYNTFLMLLLIPFFAIFTKLAFRKWGQNYYEHIVMNSIGLSSYIIITLLTYYPILYLVKSNTALFDLIINLSVLAVPLIMVWFYKGFYPDRKLKSIISRVFLLLFMVFVCCVILFIASFSLYIYSNGPEAIGNFRPK
jgi:hypothetical protein